MVLVVGVVIEGVEVSVVIEASALKVSVVREVTAEVVTAVSLSVIATDRSDGRHGRNLAHKHTEWALRPGPRGGRGRG